MEMTLNYNSVIIFKVVYLKYVSAYKYSKKPYVTDIFLYLISKTNRRINESVSFTPVSVPLHCSLSLTNEIVVQLYVG